jgi:enoyl-CoA hydratase/carnithine racemase
MTEEQRLGGALLVATDGQIATVTVNRREQRNAMTMDMWQGMADIMQELGADPEVRVIVVRGAGDKAFVAGADIAEFSELLADRAKMRDYPVKVEACMSSVEAVPKPVIAMVNGAAMGGGCELATVCDLRFAADTAKFGVPAGRLGIVITFQDTQRLTDLVGAANAKEILFTGRVLDAGEAFRIGLANRVLPAAELAAYTYEVARQIAANAPLTVRGAKRHVNNCLRSPRLVDPADGLALSHDAFASKDFREGVRAYLEKREPTFFGE